MPKLNSYQLKIDEVKIANFSFNESKIDGLSVDELKQLVNIDILSNITVDEVNELCLVNIKVQYLLKESLTVVSEIIIESKFSINPFKNVISKTEGDIKYLNDGISLTILGLTYSTLRGILFERLKGSAMQQVVLPVVDPRSLIATKNKNEVEIN